MLARLQTDGPRCAFAVGKEKADLETEFRQGLVVRQGECFHAADYIVCAPQGITFTS